MRRFALILCAVLPWCHLNAWMALGNQDLLWSALLTALMSLLGLIAIAVQDSWERRFM